MINAFGNLGGPNRISVDDLPNPPNVDDVTDTMLTASLASKIEETLAPEDFSEEKRQRAIEICVEKKLKLFH